MATRTPLGKVYRRDTPCRTVRHDDADTLLRPGHRHVYFRQFLPGIGYLARQAILLQRLVRNYQHALERHPLRFAEVVRSSRDMLRSATVPQCLGREPLNIGADIPSSHEKDAVMARSRLVSRCRSRHLRKEPVCGIADFLNASIAMVVDLNRDLTVPATPQIYR